MPMDGVTIYLEAKELNRLLAGGRVDKITQPERDEVIILIRNNNENYSLLLSASAGCARANITRVKKANPLEPPNLCMLMRKHLIGGRVRRVSQCESDRILEIEIEHRDELGDDTSKTIICEFMGKHSNIILVTAEGRIIESARRVNDTMSGFREVLPGLNYRRPPAHGKIPFDKPDASALSERLRGSESALYKALQENVSGLSSPLARELALRAAGDEDARVSDIDTMAVCDMVFRSLEFLINNPVPAILKNDEGEAKDILAFEYLSRVGQPMRKYATLSEAIDDYYVQRDLSERIKQKSASIAKTLKNNIERLEKKLALQTEALEGGARMEEYRIKGELLSACPHLIKKGMKTANVPNYYDENGGYMQIELDERISAAANAQRYFKLYRKAQNARKLASEQIDGIMKELNYLEGQSENLKLCADEASLWELREDLLNEGYIKDTASRRNRKALPPSEPLKFLSEDGTAVFVGKNNVQNEKLTFGAKPDEVWLHAKDIPGSHVIIKSENPSDETLLFAARLAAKHSKAGASSQVPVDYANRKYVKKPSGAKPGFVIYTHQRTLFVNPL